jgi:hypothetical protein
MVSASCCCCCCCCCSGCCASPGASLMPPAPTWRCVWCADNLCAHVLAAQWARVLRCGTAVSVSASLCGCAAVLPSSGAQRHTQCPRVYESVTRLTASSELFLSLAMLHDRLEACVELLHARSRLPSLQTPAIRAQLSLLRCCFHPRGATGAALRGAKRLQEGTGSRVLCAL